MKFDIGDLVVLDRTQLNPQDDDKYYEISTRWTDHGIEWYGCFAIDPISLNKLQEPFQYLKGIYLSYSKQVSGLKSPALSDPFFTYNSWLPKVTEGTINNSDTSSACDHVFKEYIGMHEAFHYCTKCDQKRP